MSLVTSCFTGSYVRFWATFFPDKQLQWTPMFDGRAVCYPTDAILRDYLAWRQADAHINNQVSGRSHIRPRTCIMQGRHYMLRDGASEAALAGMRCEVNHEHHPRE